MFRVGRVFDFTAAMRRLCSDIAMRIDDFSHVDMDRVCVTFAQARRNVSHGLQAKLTPLRFEGGSLTGVRRGTEWTVQRVYDGPREMLYILTFYCPRFFSHPLREKLVTVMHELYHISPAFDGDIRRLPGHYHVHSHSQDEYDEQMGVYADRYLAQRPPTELYEFLAHDFRSLQQRHGPVVGLKVPIPKLIPVRRSA